MAMVLEGKQKHSTPFETWAQNVHPYLSLTLLVTMSLWPNSKSWDRKVCSEPLVRGTEEAHSQGHKNRRDGELEPVMLSALARKETWVLVAPPAQCFRDLNGSLQGHGAASKKRNEGE